MKPIHFVLALTFLLASLLGLASGAAAQERDPRIPRPCLVMPHPQKAGPAPAIGGGGKYHDWHLDETATAEGLMDAAEIPLRRMDVVALLVDFEDQPMDSTRVYFEKVMTYLEQIYGDMSDGLLEIHWTVAPEVYRLPETMAFYGLDDSIAAREALLVRDAVRAGDDDVDYSQYDTFMLFHAGAGQEADINDDSREQIWSVFFRTIDLAYWLPGEGNENGVPTNDTGPDGEPFAVHSMVVCPETQSQDGFEFGIMGVVAHEFGHRFVLPDLYDTTSEEGFIFADSQGIGAFGLMGSGIWNQNGFFPAEMCAWSKYFVGWLRPEVLRPEVNGGEIAVSLEAIVKDRRAGAVRIPIGGDEYFLIENRVRDYNGDGEFSFDDVNGNGEFDFGVDSYAGLELDWYLPREPTSFSRKDLDGSGLLIWHIDESVIRENLLFNTVNATALHKGIDLEEADGIQDLDQLLFTFEAFGDPKDAFYAPFAPEFTPTSNPDSRGYNGARTEVYITDISGPGSTMTFTLRFGGFEPGWPRDLPGRVFDFQPLAADLDGNGDLEVVTCAVSDSGYGGPVILRADGTPYRGSDAIPFSTGRLRAEPILVDLGNDGSDELVWVSGDSVLAMRGDGTFLGGDGNPVVNGPAPLFVLDRDPGRTAIIASDIDGDGRAELIVGETGTASGGNVTAISFSPEFGARVFTRFFLVGQTTLPASAGDVQGGDVGLREIVTSVRTDQGGFLAVGLVAQVEIEGERLTQPVAFSLGDSVAFSAPVLGDLDRDGADDIVVADDAGWLHAWSLPQAENLPVTGERGSLPAPGQFLCGNECFEYLPGWPVRIGSLADDALSLADLDGDGHLEVLAFGPNNVLHVINYNGTSILTLPVLVKGENRFTAAFLSPLALDLDGVPGDDLALPLPDGQVRGHHAQGRPLEDWSYLGGGSQGTYPVVADIDRDGVLELVTVEDITVAIPEDIVIDNGDENAGLERRGRVVVREVGPGSGEGAWPVYRGDPARSGRAPLPGEGTPVVARGLAGDIFVMPNPARNEDPRFHYFVAEGVSRVEIEIHDLTGALVRTLEGPLLTGTDNELSWDRRSDQGTLVAPGLYVARVEISGRGASQTEIVRFAVLH